jgi:hypothetical protein
LFTGAPTYGRWQTVLVTIRRLVSRLRGSVG